MSDQPVTEVHDITDLPAPKKPFPTKKVAAYAFAIIGIAVLGGVITKKVSDRVEETEDGWTLIEPAETESTESE